MTRPAAPDAAWTGEGRTEGLPWRRRSAAVTGPSRGASGRDGVQAPSPGRCGGADQLAQDR